MHTKVHLTTHPILSPAQDGLTVWNGCLKHHSFYSILSLAIPFCLFLFYSSNSFPQSTTPFPPPASPPPPPLSLVIQCVPHGVVGKYCIYQKSHCPSGFQEGFIYWDDATPLWSESIIQGETGKCEISPPKLKINEPCRALLSRSLLSSPPRSLSRRRVQVRLDILGRRGFFHLPAHTPESHRCQNGGGKVVVAVHGCIMVDRCWGRVMTNRHLIVAMVSCDCECWCNGVLKKHAKKSNYKDYELLQVESLFINFLFHTSAVSHLPEPAIVWSECCFSFSFCGLIGNTLLLTHHFCNFRMNAVELT